VEDITYVWSKNLTDNYGLLANIMGVNEYDDLTTNSAKNHAKTHSTTKTTTERPSERFDPANATATTLTMNDDTKHRFDPANNLPNHTKTKHLTQTDKKTASSQRVLANQGDCQTTKGAKREAEQSH
jgi:hypothetical protein